MGRFGVITFKKRDVYTMTCSMTRILTVWELQVRCDVGEPIVIDFPTGKYLKVLLLSIKMAAITRIFTVLALLFVLAVSNAFVPANQAGFAHSETNLKFGILKELGFKKPSWLPDFGGKKAEAEAEVGL